MRSGPAKGSLNFSLLTHDRWDASSAWGRAAMKSITNTTLVNFQNDKLCNVVYHSGPAKGSLSFSLLTHER